MIDPRELRIGNWIHWPVRGANFEVIEVRTDMHSEHYEPILLTEEWLIKMGFETHSPGLYRIKIHPNQARYLETGLSFNKTWEFSIIIELRIEPDIEVWIRGLGAVHQVQNLYHSLTGEDLTIKE